MKGLLVKDLCLMRELKKMVLIIVFVSPGTLLILSQI